MYTGQYDRDILTELQSIDDRLADTYTELQSMHEDQTANHEALLSAVNSGFMTVMALIVIFGTIKVIFGNAK